MLWEGSAAPRCWLENLSELHWCKNKCCWLICVCTWGGGWWRDVLLQTEQKTMWGQGLQGLKVTNLLGFSLTSKAPNAWARRVNKTTRSPICTFWVCRKKFWVGGWRRNQKKKKHVYVWHQKNTRKRGFVSGFWGRHRPARFPQPPQRGKTTTTKKKRRCSHNFMHGRTFCSYKKGGKDGCRGDNICGRRYGAVLEWVFCVMGSISCQWTNRR